MYRCWYSCTHNVFLISVDAANIRAYIKNRHTITVFLRLVDCATKHRKHGPLHAANRPVSCSTQSEHTRMPLESTRLYTPIGVRIKENSNPVDRSVHCLDHGTAKLSETENFVKKVVKNLIEFVLIITSRLAELEVYKESTQI